MSKLALLHKDSAILQQVAGRVLEAFAPPHIVVDADANVHYRSPAAEKYFDPRRGVPGQLWSSVLLRGLQLDLRSALSEAIDMHRAAVRDCVDVDPEDRVHFIRLTIEPLTVGHTSAPLYLAVFTESARLSSEAVVRQLSIGEPQARELLQFSKEELRAANEELRLLNDELAARLEELHRANADLRNVFESTRIATVLLDRSLKIRSYTPAATAIFGLVLADQSRPITDFAHPFAELDLRDDLQQVIAKGEPIERRLRIKDREGAYLMRILPYRIGEHEIDGAVLTFDNVTAVVVAEGQQRVLVAELNHRVRNMLQVVLGLANQTVHRSRDLEQFEKTFFGRMQALARAYELLTRDDRHKASVSELVRTQLATFAEDNRYSSLGAPFMLRPQAALSLGLVLYELATNSTKYGALSSPAGQVRIEWRIEAAGGSDDGSQEFILDWQEYGGPAVKPPTRHGFGSELVTRQLRYELNGTAVMDFLETGLSVTLRIPVEEAIEMPESESK